MDGILKPIIGGQYILQDTFDFVNKVKDLSYSHDKFMVSFDVESLFTNVPTRETIDIILSRIFTDQVETFNGLTRDDLNELLVICTQKSHFQFNGEFYDQVDGVAMGSPLGPLFANIFMDEFEKKHMEDLRSLGVRKWFRYVDDVFAIVTEEEECQRILEYLNTRHPNIRFTVEAEKHNRLPFLDTEVVRRVGKYVTTIYHKKTFTGVYLNWTSLTSRKYKIRLIHGMLERISRICTEKEDRNLEMRKLRAILEKNDYPSNVIDAEFAKFMKSKSNRTPLQNVQQQVPTVKRFLVLPYVHKKAEKFADELKQLVNVNYPQVDFNIAFQTPSNIEQLFPFKDNVKKAEDRSLVVYRIECKQCGAAYIGKTERILYHRIREHKNGTESSCKQHEMNNEGHLMDYENVKIIDKADNDHKLRVKELLHIVKEKPELNKQLNSQSSHELRTLIVVAHPQRAQT